MTQRSWVILELDTLEPRIEVFAPNYTTVETLTLITIEANEDLSTYQEFYAIDQNGVRHDYTFFQEDKNTFIGRVRFNDNVPLGHIVFYARVMDEVGNISALYQKTIDVRANVPMIQLEIGEAERLVHVSDSARSVAQITDRSMESIADIQHLPTEIMDKTMLAESKITTKKEG